MYPTNFRKGFTLIELLVVIVIISVLAAVVGPRFFGRTEQGKIAAARAQIENMSMALDNYQLDNGYFPSDEQGLKALVEKPSGRPAATNWRGPYIKAREIPLDQAVVRPLLPQLFSSPSIRPRAPPLWRAI